MHNRFTNLLPPSRRHLLVREYYFRLGVVTIILAASLIGVAALLLMPTYVYLAGSAKEKETRLAHITASLASADEVAISARLTALANDAAALIALSKKPSVSASLRSVLGISRPGIALSGLTYTPEAKSRTLLVTGTAATRDALRAYQIALEDMPGAISATLPVSVYAKDTDIGFTITITLAP